MQNNTKATIKKLSFTILFGSMLAMMGCGGDSDSSGATYNQVYKKTLSNGNVYQCSSESVASQCTTDKACKAAKCELIKQVTPVVDDNELKPCAVSGKFITGINNQSCKFENEVADAGVVVSCISNQLVLNGSIGNVKLENTVFKAGSTQIQTFNFKCP